MTPLVLVPALALSFSAVPHANVARPQQPRVTADPQAALQLAAVMPAVPLAAIMPAAIPLLAIPLAAIVPAGLALRARLTKKEERVEDLLMRLGETSVAYEPDVVIEELIKEEALAAKKEAEEAAEQAEFDAAMVKWEAEQKKLKEEAMAAKVKFTNQLQADKKGRSDKGIIAARKAYAEAASEAKSKLEEEAKAASTKWAADVKRVAKLLISKYAD